MSAILHSITTSIENDRMSAQLRNWWAKSHLRLHKEKYAPVLEELNWHSAQHLQQEIRYEENNLDLYFENMPTDDDGNIEVVLDTTHANAIAYPDNPLYRYEDKLIIAYFDEDGDRWDGNFKVLNTPISDTLKRWKRTYMDIGRLWGGRHFVYLEQI